MGKKYSSDSKNAWGFSYDFSVNKPIDTRSVVDKFEDLINPETWKVGADYMCYKGMAVACADTGKIYVYRGQSGLPDFIKHDYNWISQGEKLDVATESNLGGIKIGYSENNKNYPVQLSDGKAYVYVPWTDTNTTYSNATTTTAGLMSAADKSKLDGIAAEANNYTLSTATDSILGGVKVTGDKGLVMGGTNNEELAVNFDNEDYSEIEDISAYAFSTTTVASPNVVNKIVTAKLNEAIYEVLNTPM